MYKVSRLRVYSILALALILDLTLLDHIKIFGVKPDLVLISVVFFGLFLGRRMGIETGFVAGFLKDIFALDYFGINAFVIALTGLIAGILGAKFSRESRRTQVLLVIFLTAFSMTIHFILASIFSKGLNFGFGGYLIGSIIPSSLYNAILSIPIFFKFMGIYNIRGSEEYL